MKLEVVKEFSDGVQVCFGQGKFDAYCVYLDGNPPKDIDYFTRLQQLSSIFSGKDLYGDFVSIYDSVTKNVENLILENITNLSHKYDPHIITVDKLFTVLYMAMIAEENKAYTKLGKRIKRLGMHQLLIEKLSAEKCASYSKGMKWREIDEECVSRGF
jgi:hypothetical protein